MGVIRQKQLYPSYFEIGNLLPLSYLNQLFFNVEYGHIFKHIGLSSR